MLELSYYEGLTQEEIAERLREPLGTIKSRIRAALIKLRSTSQAPNHSERNHHLVVKPRHRIAHPLLVYNGCGGRLRRM